MKWRHGGSTANGVRGYGLRVSRGTIPLDVRSFVLRLSVGHIVSRQPMDELSPIANPVDVRFGERTNERTPTEHTQHQTMFSVGHFLAYIKTVSS